LEELAGSVREISAQVKQFNRIASSAVQQADETDARINALSLAANRIGVKISDTLISGELLGSAIEGFAVKVSKRKAPRNAPSKRLGAFG
jgi:hypothetical protein